MFEFCTPPKPDLAAATKNGRRDSAQGTLPAAGGMPSIIIKWREKFENFRNGEMKKAQVDLKELGSKASVAVSKITPLSLKTRFNEETPCLHEINIPLVNAALQAEDRELQEREQNFTRFQRIHERPYLPVRADVALDPWNAYRLIVGLFVVEAIINAALFLPSAKGGAMEAMILSTSQAFINIVSCYIIGLKAYGPATAVPLSSKKVIYWFIFSTHLVFILWLNLSIGRWRSIMIERDIFEDISASLSQIVTWYPLAAMPFGSTWSMPSAIVVGVGMVLALLAYMKGYLGDDPYPRYGAQYRYVLRSRNRTLKHKETLAGKIRTARREFSDANVSINDKAFEDIETWSEAIDDMEEITDNYRLLLQGMNNSFANVCDAYKQGYTAVNPDAANTLKLSEPLFKKEDFNRDDVFQSVSHQILNDPARLAKKEEHEKKLEKTLEEIEKEYTDNLDEFDADFIALSQRYNSEANNVQAASEANNGQAE